MKKYIQIKKKVRDKKTNMFNTTRRGTRLKNTNLEYSTQLKDIYNHN